MRRAIMPRLPMLLVLILVAAAVAWPAAGFGDDLITDVRLSNPVLDLKDDNAVRISWRLDSSARLNAFICNLDGEIVKKLHKKPEETRGGGSMEWDGRDDDGLRVPDGAYLPIIQAQSDQRHQLFNSTLQPWGQRVETADIAYDSAMGLIRYRLNQPALCLIRVGETDGGPFYATVAQWIPRATGTHQEEWNGKDAQGLVRVAESPKLKIMIDAIALPSTAILVTGSSRKHRFERGRKERIPLFPPVGSEIFMHSLHERRTCRDIDIRAEVEDQSENRSGLPVLRAIANARVEILDPDHLAHLRREGVEIYAFIDALFVSEIKIEDFPAHININTDKLAAGEHVLTINVRGREDHLGTYSMAVIVEK